jgi:hypothetical protein
MCIEVVIPREVDPAKRPPLRAIIIHNHGAVLEVNPHVSPKIGLKGLRPLIYVEAGTNEPQPMAGDDGETHTSEPGVREIVHKDRRSWAVRPHNGTVSKQNPELRMDTRKAVINLKKQSNTEAKAVVEYEGKCGEDGDSPQSPYHNDKMRRRIFKN